MEPVPDLLEGVWPWSAASEGAALVLTHALPYQYLSGLLIGMGVGGVVGASTLGVAMFSLVAPAGHLRDFTAVVPVVNCLGNLATISVYVQHANWGLCFRMWPFILLGIGAGTFVLPLLEEVYLRKATSVIYGLVLVQRVLERVAELRAKHAVAIAKKTDGEVSSAGSVTELESSRQEFYSRWWVSALVSVACGVITVVTNNSGPIFNIYLLACGLDMDQFVASRSVMMAGKNFAKVGARMLTGGLSLPVAVHSLQIGALTAIGIQLAKPIKRRTSPEMYTYFTWCMLLYTCVKMW